MKLLKEIKAVKSRTKQKGIEALGFYQATDDSDFQALYAEWKGTVNSGRHLQATARGHINAQKKYCQTSAALSVELAAFHRGTPAEGAATALGQVHADLERVQLAAIERLYEEEMIASIDLLLWQVPEVEERVKLRRKLLTERNAQQRKYDNACAAHAENQQNQTPNGGSGGGLFRRAKGESELSAEVATRRVKLEHAQAAVEEATEWCLTQFRELLDKRETGNALGGPMAAFFSCQHKMMAAGAHKLNKIRQHLPQSQAFDETLGTYEAEFARIQAASGNDLFDGFNANNSLLNGSSDVEGAFGAPIPDTCPLVIREAIEYLMTHGGLEAEGLFRVPGNADVVDEVAARYNAGESDVIEQLGCDHHDVAAIIKRYLKDLPDSLIPQDFYRRVVEVGRVDDGGDSLAEVVGEIPEPHLQCLSPLLHLLYKIARRSDINRMTFANLATCLAPTIVRAPADESPAKIMDEMQVVIMAVKTLIEQAKRYDLSTQPPRAEPVHSHSRSAPQSFSSHHAAPLPPQAPSANRHMSRRMGGAGSGRGISSMLGSARRMSMRRDSSSTTLTAGMW